MTTGGFDLSSMFSKATADLDKEGTELQKKIDAISAKETIDQKDLIQLQFAMGQYNAKIETLSSVIKSLQDMLKSLAQRTG